MKKLLILLLLGVAGFQLWNKYGYPLDPVEPLYDKPYVVVYGRNSCGWTQQTLKELKRSGVPFEYKSVDDRSTADVLHKRMQKSGIDTRRYNLPVVDASNHISVRPETGTILSNYRNYSP